MYDFSKAHYDDTCDFLLDTDFRALFEIRDIEFSWSVLKYFISEAVFLFTPKIFVSHSNDPKWFNSEIRHHLKCLQCLRRKFKSHPTLHIMNKIQQSEKNLQSKIQQAKSNYESKLIASFHSISSRSSLLSCLLLYPLYLWPELPSSCYVSRQSVCCQ